MKENELAVNSNDRRANLPEENKMGTEPIRKLLITMSLPLIVSNLVQALYNIVDSIFVSRINEDALTAVTLCFPFQMLMISFGIGTAVGMGALLSRYLGAGLTDKVDKVAHNGILLGFLNYAIFFSVGLFLSETLIEAQINDPVVIEYGKTYLSIVCMLSIGFMMQITVERLLQATGKTIYILFTQGIGAVINIILDPILIFGWFGAPEMGIAGAAAATVFGQIFAFVLGLIFNIKKNHEVTLHIKHLKPDFEIIKEIYRIAIPSIIMQSIGSVMNIAMNKVLVSFTKTAVAVFGVYFKLQSFIFMPVFGLNNGVVPIAAYNYGARKRDRLEEVMKISVSYAIVIMLLGTITFWAIPDTLLGMFDASPYMLEIGRSCLRTISLCFPFAAYAIMRGAIFQALGKSVYSMNISIMRQLLVLIPASILLGMTGNVNNVWWAFPIAEVVGCTSSVLYTRRIRRKIINNI
ncbi:MAG: MATE family efflux transporter [Firmicutes bacterium]|nr:MATE family efflux transporter [Bacillota bacterium]